MRKFLLPALGLLAALGATTPALAHTYTCGLAYDVKGGGLQVGLGYFKLSGTGMVTCKDVHGNESQRAVNVTIGGHPVSARVGAGYLHVYGLSSSFGFNGSLEDLYGHYVTTDVQAAVILGAGVSSNFQNPMNGVRLSLGVSGSLGFGFETGLSILTLEPAGDQTSAPSQDTI
ncbi:MAG: hypothetical protein ACO3A2_07855 [Bdellovibrionia bacterium]